MTEFTTEKLMVSKLIEFIVERHRIHELRSAGKPRPWTTDKILQRYRFCNMYRELDAVTVWIAKNWRDPNTNDKDVWFAMLVARYVNEPETMELLGYPIPWKTHKWFQVVEERKRQHGNVFNAAYVIHTGGTHKTGPKHHTLDSFFHRMWSKRKEFRPNIVFDKRVHGALKYYCSLLTAQPGVGTFMAGQVIADLKYTNPYLGCDDWWTFAVSGPGSRRGLNRICGRDVNTRWKEDEWFFALNDLRLVVNHRIIKTHNMQELHGQDMQNCLCEFDKYMRTALGEGKPKQKFSGV